VKHGQARTVPRETSVTERLGQLAYRHQLEERQVAGLAFLLDLLSNAETAPTTVTTPEEAVDVHIADSLSALELPALESPSIIADLGSGAGFPAMVLAIARPQSHVVAVESVGRKARFIASLAESLRLVNLEVVATRIETWSARAGTCDVVCARALASLPVLCEYAAPLLRPGGSLVAWKGMPAESEVAAGAVACARLGMAEPVALAVEPYPGSRNRHLYHAHKVGDTPPGFPRRPGMAVKRPLA
jgi:16S rRNA (guanine527-N7)-methyltransferase